MHVPVFRWKIEWHWADSPVSSEAVTSAVHATLPSKFKLTPTGTPTSTPTSPGAVRPGKKHKHKHTSSSSSGPVKKHKHTAKYFAKQRAKKLAKAAANAAYAMSGAGKQGRKLLAA